MSIIQKQSILEVFTQNPKELYSITDVLEELGLELNSANQKKVENTVRNFRISKDIVRHKNKDVNNDFQYAVKLKEEDIDVWVLNKAMSIGVKGKVGKKKKGGLLTKKEIQSMFAAQYNTLAKLEDEAMRIIEEFENVEKEMKRIRNVIGR